MARFHWRFAKESKRNTTEIYLYPVYKSGESYMYFSTNMAQRYILKLHGTGQLMSSRKGDWVKKGRVQSSEPIGVYIDRDGNAHETCNEMIIYSKDGTHIYPTREEDA